MPNLRPPLIIALDGPAASGKSTVAIRIAEKMDIFYINTGYMYRAVALRCMQKGVSHDADIAKIKEVVENIKFEIKEKRIMVDGQDISKEVASVEVENKVSYFASLKAVREVLIKKQRQLANEHSVILDGRDIGTVVFPKAQIKIFLSATPQTRAKRRYEELKQKFPDKTLNYEEILKDIIKRDNMDAQRAISPLKKANDAIEIDTTFLSLEDTYQQVLSTIIIHSKKTIHKNPQ